MEKQLTNVNQFFDVKDLNELKLSDIVNSEEFAPVREEIKKKLMGIPVPAGFFKQMIGQVSELLNIDVRGILAKAWCRSKELVQFVSEMDMTSDEIVLLPLLEHSIVSDHAPSFKPKINKIPLKEIKFNVNLEIYLKGVILNIQKGRIMQAEIGSCEGAGAVRYKTLTLFEKKSEPLTLPKSIDFGDGIAIDFAMKN